MANTPKNVFFEKSFERNFEMYALILRTFIDNYSTIPPDT
jgi:hypothetical protein